MFVFLHSPGKMLTTLSLFLILTGQMPLQAQVFSSLIEGTAEKSVAMSAMFTLTPTPMKSATSVQETASSGKQSTISLNIYTEDMPPYQFINIKNHIVGINIELLSLILEEEGISYHIQLSPWTRAYKNTLADKFGGLISTAFTTARADKFKWVGPFTSSADGVYLFRLASKNNIVIEKLADLKKYSIGYVRFGIYEQIFRNHGFDDTQLLGFSKNSECFKMLFNGKIDLALGSNITIAKSLAMFGFPVGHVEKAYRIGSGVGNFLALNLEVPDDVVNRLNKRLKLIRESQRAADIINKYSSTDKVKWEGASPYWEIDALENVSPKP